MRRGLAGSLCPNADLGDGRRLDDATAGRFAVITTASPPAALRAVTEQRGAVVLTAGQDTELHRWLRGQHARAAVLRPDGTVLHAGRDLAAACATLTCCFLKPRPGDPV
jgi:3-(3-hydroxy-phenyl)propionate hydroxylase